MLNHVGALRPGGRCAVAKLLACSMLTTASMLPFAQKAKSQVAATVPVRESIDSNGVDLFFGTMNANGPTLSAGQGDAGLSWQKIIRGNQGWGDNLVATLSVDSGTVLVAYGGKTDRFTISGSSYVPTEANGSRLSLSGNVYTYVLADGTVIHFNKMYVGAAMFQSITGVVTDVTKPSGEKLTYTFESMYYCSQSKEGADGQICTGHSYAYRVSSVQSSSGYKLTYDNASQYADPTDIFSTDWLAWNTTLGVSLTNVLIPGATSRYQATTFSAVAPYLYLTITDPIGRATIYRRDNTGLVGIKRPGSSTEDVQIAYSGGRVSAITTPAGVTSYAFSDAGNVRTTTVTDPLGHATIYTFDIALQRMKSVTTPAPVSQTTQWDYDIAGRVSRVTAPEGDYTQYTYDGRGNVVEVRRVAKGGSGLTDITSTAGYDTSCVSSAKCNQPNWTKGANGGQTDYSYDSATGQLLTVMAPAPTPGGVRPTTTYTYTTVNGVQKLGSISACRTAASCAGTADEIKTTIGYNGNGHPTSASKGAGDGSLTAVTTVAYDDVGNVLTMDGPLAGTADTKRYRYDAARQVVGVVGSDPDGGGALKPRAQRATYDLKGRVTLTEAGNVNSQGDGDWAGFVPQQQVAVEYDGMDRKIKETASSSGTPYQVIQYSYDAAGRLDCTALRMNSATWNSLPGACTLAATGAAGPDRISRNLYDNANRPTVVQTAYGTADQTDEVKSTYTTNGQIASVTDGEGNKTSFEYDGFDRQSKTFYPVASPRANSSSASDYEQLSFDPGGNITSRRLRDGQVIGFSYDALGRVTLKDLPGSEPDIAYAYNLVGQVVGVTRPDISHSFSYDALGRLTSEAQPFGAISYQYDLAGRRTRMSWWDGVYVDYDYLTTGEVTAIRENGATSGVGVLASYSYDQLGHRSSITRGNGTSSNYSYDGASRLSSLSEDLSGSSYDFTHGFGYNPAGQITSQTRSNDTYAWTGHYNVDRGYTINGLNQATTAGPTTLGYDARGNLTSSGSSAYTYSSENLLKSGPGVTLYYDVFGRLVEYDTSTSTRFVYDGGHMAAEVANPSGAIMRRYVFGPGADEALLWYEGSGLSDRRWLHADERGSVVAVTGAGGSNIGVNRYDEYGIPGAGNVGRFQYTGQAWLPELGMSYYKARIYSPSLGRFMQTDPVGYSAGMNLYNYVGGDPVNFTDPTGMEQFCFRNKTSGYYYDSHGELVLWNSTGPEQCVDISPPARGPEGHGGGGGGGGSSDSETEGPCEVALAEAAAASAAIGLPFGKDRLALHALGYGKPRGLRLTDKAMALASAYVDANPGYVLNKVDLPNGLVRADVNFGKRALGGVANGPDTGSLGAILGRSTVYLSEGKLVGVEDVFDYDPSNADFPLWVGMKLVNDDINLLCPNRVKGVRVVGGVVK